MVNKEKRHTFKKYRRTWKKTPTIFQMEATECGAVSLAMILAYYKCHIPIEQLRVDCGVSRDGCNANNILVAAEKYGLKSDAYSCSIDELAKRKNPCIIHWDFNHFVVFEGIKGKYAYINDPANGRRKISWEELNTSFTGIVLCFKKTDALKPNKKTSTIWSFLYKRIENQKQSLIALIIVGLLLVLPGIMTAVFSKIFIDSILPYKSLEWAQIFFIIIIITMIFQFFMSMIRAVIASKLQMKLSLVFGYRFLSKMMHMSIGFFEQRYAGDLSQRIVNNDNANSFLTGRLAVVFLDILTAIFYLSIMIYYSWYLTIIGLIGVCITLIMWKLFSNKIKDLAIKIAQDNGRLIGVLFSGLEISRTLKASGVENTYVRKVYGNYSKVADSEQKIGQLREIMSSVPACVTQITSICILMVGASLTIDGNMTMGMLTAFGVIFSSFSSPINALFSEFQEIQNLNADLSRVDDIERQKIDEKFLKESVSTNDVDKKIVGSIDIKNMTFGYNKLNKPIVKDFNLHIEPGEIVALVGASGCGKSTILKIVSGLCKPWEGEVLFDGKNFEDYPTNVISASLSSISQDIIMFSGSINENLTLWNNLTMQSQIVEAAKDACIHDHITTMDGAYNYQLKQGAINLSGGQRQCLEIARALVCNPSILIMDEATSALDPVTEQKVINNIKRRGCTCLVVAHRLTTIRDANLIVYIEDGKIAEIGTHDELIKRNGKYKLLVENS